MVSSKLPNSMFFVFHMLRPTSIWFKSSFKAVGSPTPYFVKSEQGLSPIVTFSPMCSLRHDLRLDFILCLLCSHSPSPNIFRPVLFSINSIGPILWVLDFFGMLSPTRLRESVEKSGTVISSPISRAKPPTNPCNCRKGCLKIIPSVRHTDMAISDYVGWPPGV